MALQGTARVVAGGDVQAVVAGVFPPTYQVGITPSWVTGWRVTSKTASSFTVDFAVPAPAGGATFDWTAGNPVSPDSGASQAITTGAVTVTITGVFSSVYQVALGPSWMTSVDVISQTGTTFTVQFAVPAPAGQTLDWIAVVPINTTAAPGVVAPIASASQSIAAGAITLAVAVTGALPAVYEVTVAPGWVTDYQVILKTSGGFTINFAVPAPAGGSTVLWVAFGPNTGRVSLADYLDELRDLLHDPNDRFWSSTQKIRYINKAMTQRDLDTGANRQTFTFTLTAGVGSYTLDQISGRIFDVISITLLFGQTRNVLDNPSLTDLNIFYRPQTTFTGWTAAWARQGPSTILMGPLPSIAFVTEWDCCVYSLPLINLTDTDPLPYPYTKPVPFYAAYLAKINERQHADEAMEFKSDYEAELGVATSSRVGRIPNSYTGMGQPWLRR